MTTTGSRRATALLMLPHLNVPACPTGPLTASRGCFTALEFADFVALVTGFVRPTAAHTVCGALTGAGLEQLWHHSRAY
ncbi:MAG: hypothetical protein ACRDYA_16120 [Egibacteraceae bacterium]